MAGLNPTGRCHNCGEEIVAGALFCGLLHAENYLRDITQRVTVAEVDLADDAAMMFHRAMSIFADRSKRYGTENIAAAGVPGVLARIRDKLARAENLLDEGTPEMAVDTAIDLANYSIILASLAAETWPSSDDKTVLVLQEPAHSINMPQREGDVGYDLRAAKSHIVPSMVPIYIPTGVRIAMPTKTWCTIVGRSSLLRRHKTVVPTCVIDTGYTGPIEVCLINHGEQYEIEAGERIAQLVFHKSVTPQLEDTAELPETERASLAFGSTGRK